jgi:hypothetical protein
VTATYDATLATPLDRVRFRLGDTMVSPADSAELSDEEITALLDQHGSSEAAATLAAARALYARYTRLISTSVGDTSVQLGEIATNYRILMGDLERELTAASGGATPYAGGISQSDKLARETDTNRVVPAFGRTGVGSIGPPVRSRFGDYG